MKKEGREAKHVSCHMIRIVESCRKDEEEEGVGSISETHKDKGMESSFLF